MLSALLLALREGVEAALVVGIVLVYLNRTGRRALSSYVWGVLMLVASALVVSMIVWMNRAARHLKKQIEQRVETYAQRETRAGGWAIGFFVFLMVVREGAELVLILRAVELSSAGVQVWIGTTLGIAIAIAVGLFFFEGTLKIPLHRFFKATSAILMVVAFQLALTGIHELSESMWIPSSKTEMSTIGPIVRNEVFFFVIILGFAALVVLREWFSSKDPAVDKKPGAEMNPADRRMRDYEFRRQRRWSFAAAILCVTVVFAFAGEYVYGRVAAAPVPAKTLVADNSVVRVPLSELTDASLHYYTADVNNTVVRFLVIHQGNGNYATALDACQICGASGYRQEGQNIICRNCAAAIYAPSIGEAGGCNPILVRSHVEAGQVVIDLSSLADSLAKIHS